MDNILNEVKVLYNRKNSDYGNSFSETLTEFGLIASATRMSDKFNRFKSLIKNNNQQVTDEKLEDTLIDLASYALMTVKWIRENGT